MRALLGDWHVSLVFVIAGYHLDAQKLLNEREVVAWLCSISTLAQLSQPFWGTELFQRRMLN